MMYGRTHMYNIFRSLGLRRANVEARDTVETQVGEIGGGVAIEPASFHTLTCMCSRAKIEDEKQFGMIDWHNM